jgi:hypothetical protein
MAMAINVSPGCTTWTTGGGEGVGVSGGGAVGNARVAVGRTGTVDNEMAAVGSAAGVGVGAGTVTT